jgi:conjugal transfer mating pair stabilization protein TraG
MTDMSIVTYGGGEILKNVFNALAILFNGDSGGIIQPVCVVSASVGALIALTRAFFNKSSMISTYFIPLVVVSGILTIPSTTIVIEDVVTQKGYKVDHVPYLLAKTSEMVGYLGYNITRAVNKAMHTPNDTNYNSTGMIFGSETSLEISKFHITNADLDRNLRTFCKQCMLYDIALGMYSIDQVKRSSNLWKFFEDNTSNVRMMKYTDPTVKDKNSKSTYLTCKKSVEKMKPFFENEKIYYSNHDVLKNLPLTFQAVTGIKRPQEELIGQQLMMNVITDEYNPGSFAKNRAYMQQRSTYQVLGGLASKSLVTMRIVLEALVYASFLFILPLTLLPNGIKFFSTWLGLVAWIQLWPPFFSILNYIMQTVSQSKASSILDGLSQSEAGLSFFTSLGLHNLQEDIFAMAGYLAISIPFISYAIVKGGVGSFVHLSSSMMSPAQGAASAAALEQTTGNYSYGNTQFGNDSYGNATSLQRNLAPSLNAGYSTMNSGDWTTISTGEKQILNQNTSNIGFSVEDTKVFSDSINRQYQEAETQTSLQRAAFSSSLSEGCRNVFENSEKIGEATSLNTSNTIGESSDVSQASSRFNNLVRNVAEANNVSTDLACKWVVSAGFGSGALEWVGLKAGSDGSLSAGQNKVKMSSDNLGYMNGNDFREDIRTLMNYSSSQSAITNRDYSSGETISNSSTFDTLKNESESYESSIAHLNQLSEAKSFMDSNSTAGRSNYTQPFVDWSMQERGVSSESLKDMVYSPQRRGELLNHFTGFLESNGLHVDKIDGHGFKGVAPSPEKSIADTQASSIENNKTRMQAHKSGIKTEYSSISDRVDSLIDQKKEHVSSQESHLKSKGVERNTKFGEASKGYIPDALVNLAESGYNAGINLFTLKSKGK